MAYDTSRAAQKKAELVRMAETLIRDYWQTIEEDPDVTSVTTIATEFIDNFIQITPPEMPRMEMITMRQGGYGGGRSTKPGNISLNMRTLLVDLAEVITIGGAALSVPWTRYLAAIRIWNKLRTRLTIEISEREAVLLWIMWKNRDHTNHVADDSLLDLVNKELLSNGRTRISKELLGESLEVLGKLRCIDRSTSLLNKWWLREWVRVPYN
jgi:hypothetical protein